MEDEFENMIDFEEEFGMIDTLGRSTKLKSLVLRTSWFMFVY